MKSELIEFMFRSLDLITKVVNLIKTSHFRIFVHSIHSLTHCGAREPQFYAKVILNFVGLDHTKIFLNLSDHLLFSFDTLCIGLYM